MEKIAWGSFAIIQGGITVASGSGPLDDIRREARHYAAVYAQDGHVRVRVRRLKDRTLPTRTEHGGDGGRDG